MPTWLKLGAAVAFLVAWPIIPLISLNDAAHSSAWWNMVAIVPASLALFLLVGVPWIMARPLRLRVRQVAAASPDSTTIPINAHAGSRCVLSLGKDGITIVPMEGVPHNTPWSEIVRVDMIRGAARPGFHIEAVLTDERAAIPFVPLGPSAVHPMRKAEISSVFAPWVNAAIDAGERKQNPT